MSDIEAVLGEDEAEAGDDIGNEEARSCHYYDNNERFLVRIRCRQAEMRLAISNTGFKAIWQAAQTGGALFSMVIANGRYKLKQGSRLTRCLPPLVNVDLVNPQE